MCDLVDIFVVVVAVAIVGVVAAAAAAVVVVHISEGTGCCSYGKIPWGTSEISHLNGI